MARMVTNMSDQDLAFTLDERTAMSQAFSSGDTANAYGSTNLENFGVDAMPEHVRCAFLLGFFSSYSLDEIPGDCRELFDECYWSRAGRYVVTVAKYTGDRAEQYAAEACAEEATC